jgi:hypothetical protein
MPWDDELSLEQREYAAHPALILRLVAGPGTGKTRLITRRVGYPGRGPEDRPSPDPRAHVLKSRRRWEHDSRVYDSATRLMLEAAWRLMQTRAMCGNRERIAAACPR